jgi:hypothetical protein
MPIGIDHIINLPAVIPFDRAVADPFQRKRIHTLDLGAERVDGGLNIDTMRHTRRIAFIPW